MSCSDVQTIKAGDGSKLTFSFDFPYIFKSEIHVYFWNATTKEYDEKLTTDSTYPWRITDANPTIVEFTSNAPPAPATPVDPGESAVDNVKIRRVTKVDDIRALFNPGSAIRSDDLNKNFEQLRYAIQESNCQGIPDDVDQYLKDYYWDRYDNTLYDGDAWVSDDTKIATTAALDARFQDEVNDTFTKAELAAASNIMPDDDVAVPTTGALDNYINEVITNDIGSSDGVTITDDGDGTITVGLADNSVDFDKIKDADQIQLADQIADPDVEGTDNNIFTAKAATRRFNNYYQNEAPTATDGIGEGQVWVDPNDDLTLSVWSGSAWVGITSGGTFTNQPKVVYVDASSGDDANDGHRISRPKQSIKAAITQINADDTHGNGSIVVVAPGVYQEACPIQITKRDVAIVGTSVRNCVVHPTPATETATMFEVNSGTYLKNLTFTGMKASGTRGDTGSLWENTTYGLPPTQGWNVAFYDDAMIYKSPYIQNCTNFSDSEIDNSDLDFYAGDEDKGRAGDLDSAPTGGGLLVDGSTPHADSPLRSIVCDSYTHTGLDAPGIFVTNNGYMQATSSYAFFNHAHITCINGGQANLAASTTDFGRYGLVASGKSTSAIFTSTIDGAVSDGATSFNIDAPTAASGWHGSATRPQGNMLVTVNSVTYPILSATANGSGWTVTISRPDSSNRSNNLGVNGAISDGAAVSFFLRSMIASSGHTMEYVGSGTNYSALPGNGGVPVEANQKIELDNGKIWTATTDQNGKFTVGGNQTDDPFFEVDQQLGFVTIPEGSIAFNLLSDETPQLGGNLDVNGREIVTDADNENIVLNPHGTGQVNVSTSRIINVADPSSDQDAATKAYVDTQIAGIDEVVEDTSPQLGGNLDLNSNNIDGTGDIDITGSVTASANSEVNGVSIGRGLGNVATNTVVGNNALDANTTGASNTAIGDEALTANTTGSFNTAIGHDTLTATTTTSANTAVGSRSLENNTGASNTALGYASLQDNTSGTQNVAVGYGAANSNTTADNNTAVGYSSLTANTTGEQNVAVGSLSLDANTTASYNSAIGYHALGSNTEGSENTALGRIALQDNTTGNRNTAVGSGALENNTTANDNTAVGRDSLKTNITGYNNTAVGSFALSDNTAQNNTGVGKNALKANTSGGENTAIGTHALDANTTASNNTAIGYDALTANTTGTRNQAMGAYALDANTTGDDNVGLGYSSLSANTTGNDNVAVGVQSLRDNTTANNNLAVGRDALKVNTTGDRNIAVGNYALDANTTADHNTSVGYNSLGANTTGTQNVAVGSLALDGNTTFSENTAVGYNALSAGTAGACTAIGSNALRDNTAANNTAVGRHAMLTNTSGTQNAAVGSHALDANTTGGSNTAVGYNSMSANTTANNNTALGYETLSANTTGTQNTAVGAAAGRNTTTGYNCVFVGDSAGASNTTGHHNTAVGRLALNVNTTADQNTAVGAEALQKNTADSNTAVGYQALEENTSGTQNIAIGPFALDSNTTADNNIAVGYLALQANTTGTQNTAVGTNALDANTTASYNTAFGAEALTGNTTGANNTAVGRNSLSSATTANHNTAVGSLSLYANTTGTQNTAVGGRALDASTTASNNTAVGFDALTDNTSGTENVAVGVNALANNTTASNCTAVGYKALDANTTGSSNTAFGHESLRRCSTGDNNCAIGREALENVTTAQQNTAVGNYTLYNNNANENTAVGYSALFANTSGTFNTAVGENALVSNTTGNKNTAVGNLSLDASTTAANNVAVGYRALTDCTTGEQNTALGTDALYDTTTGVKNTAVGYNALASNISASNNTAVGVNALVSSTSGDSNTAVGRGASNDLTSAVNNTSVGYFAGGSVTTGNGNTFYGKSAGDGCTTGANNICIGEDADIGSSDGIHRITIGVGIVDKGDNTFTFGKANNRVHNQFISNATWSRDSDIRLKKDIQTNTDLGLNFINDLRTVTYKWKAPSELDSSLPGYNAAKTEADYTPKMYGFIAQEVKQALDDHNVTDFAGWTTDNEGIQGISYEMFVMPLVKAVQELSAKNTALEARIAALESA